MPFFARMGIAILFVSLMFTVLLIFAGGVRDLGELIILFVMMVVAITIAVSFKYRIHPGDFK